MIVPCYKMHAFRYEEPRNSKKNIRSYFLTQLMWSQGERLRSSKNPSVELDQYMMTRSLQDGPPTSYKWRYNPCKWPYTLVTGVITFISGVKTLFIAGDGAHLVVLMGSEIP